MKNYINHIYNNYDKIIYLDTETTGLSYDSKIVEIAIINYVGEILLNTLVNPEMPIPLTSSKIYNITNDMIIDLSLFKNLIPKIELIFKNKIIIIYNSEYDTNILESNGLNMTGYNIEYAMKLFATFYGDYSNSYKNYRYHKLDMTYYYCTNKI